MKLQQYIYPDFHKKRLCILPEEADNVFVGRELELKAMWDKLSDLLTGRRVNWSMLAQRKMGKTALMKRFFNVMYWEQNQVVPLYYCLKNRKGLVSDIAHEMTIAWLRQWMAFITKNPEWEDIGDLQLLEEEIKTLKPKQQEIFHKVMKLYNNKRKIASGKEHIRASLAVVQSLSKQFKMPCVLMIDEMQELASGIILNEQGEEIRCEDELFEVVMDPNIWTIGAGSQVSMLAYEVVINHLANRVRSQKFYPLKQKDSEELARKLLKQYKYKGYKGIERDVYRLVGGNPFYIISLLSPSHHYTEQKEKNKKFESSEDLQEIFDFEVMESGGEIFTFWENHFNTYHSKLNNDPEGQKGLSYRLLRYVAQNKERIVYYDELVEEFQLDKEVVDRKIQQLERADLLRRHTPEEIAGLQDEILGIVLLRIYYPAIMGKSDPKRMQEMLMAEVHKRLDKFETQVNKYRGEVSNVKGANFEQKVKEAAMRGKWKILNGYKVSETLRSVIYTSGRRSYQVDLVGALTAKKTNGKGRSRPGLIIEVKDRKQKVGIAQARKFHEAIKLAKKQEKYSKTINLFISTGGFTAQALKYLTENKIHHLSGKKI